jgi:hypothetical protein
MRFYSAGRAVLCAASLLAMGLAAPLAALPKAADPEARVPRTQYRPVIETYVPFRPVEPRSWLGVNQDVAPKPKPKPKSGDKRQR